MSRKSKIYKDPFCIFFVKTHKSLQVNHTQKDADYYAISGAQERGQSKNENLQFESQQESDY